MKQLLISYLLALSSFVIAGSNIAYGSEPMHYGAKVVFTVNTPLQFADFTLTYLGTRLVRTYPNTGGFLYYDFRVIQGTESLVVSWSAGTGEAIGYRPFTVSDTQFFLELQHSNTLGQLKDNELVITKAPSKI